MKSLYILEFGGQLTDVIGNRLRDMGFPVKYAPSSASISDMPDAVGYILSGGPKSVNDPGRYPHDPRIFESGKPTLGICYGMQLIGQHLGAAIHNRTREYGETYMTKVKANPLFDGLDTRERVWMNHGDSVMQNVNMIPLAYTDKGVLAAMKHASRDLYAVQFHPEAKHTDNGRTVLRNFAKKICKMTPEQSRHSFNPGKFIDEATAYLGNEAGTRLVVAYTSGGVDSTAAVRLAQIAGLKLAMFYLDMGNGRKDEAEYVKQQMKRAVGREPCVLSKGEHFIRELYGIDDPKAKRDRFAELYADTSYEIFRGFENENPLLLQGTIATDRRESGREAGKKSDIDKGTVDEIKGHHNKLAEDIWKGRSIAALHELTKDQVRMVARELGLPKEISERPPFPGPGMFVRYVTGFYKPDRELITKVSATGSDYGCDCYVLPRKRVGLKGDSRTFEHIALIAGERDWSNVRLLSKDLIESFPVSGVLYSPEKISLSQYRLNRRHRTMLSEQGLDRLREVTDVVEKTMHDYNVKASQTPVATFSGYGGPMNWLLDKFGQRIPWINIIRDVDSEDFRTCRPLRKPDEFPWECYDLINTRMKETLGPEAGLTTFAVEDKPGGTTELE